MTTESTTIEAPSTAATPISERSIQLLESMISSGQDLCDAAGITRENLEALYQVGHSYYLAGDYPNAETIFASLCLYNTRNVRNWLALGAARQAQGHFEAAAGVFNFAQLLDLEDPEPVVKTSECYLAAGEIAKAADSLETLREMTENKSSLAELHDFAVLLLNEIRSTNV